MQSLWNWLQEIQNTIHWYSQWIVFCPFLTSASARPGREREEAESRLVSKFLFSLLIQISVGVMSVAIGSWLTLQIIGYRMDRAEEVIKTIQNRQLKNEDRIGATEAELAVIRERHRLEEREKK